MVQISGSTILLHRALYPPVDFPETFAGLVETFEPLVDDLATQCPEEATERRSEERWERVIFDAEAAGCHASEPSDFE